MRKNKYLTLIILLALTGCTKIENNNSSTNIESSSSSSSSSSITSSSSIIEEKIETYTSLYSADEEVMIYGYVGMEEFDLTSIDATKVASSKLTYSTDDTDIVNINENKLTFLNKGLATLYGEDDENNTYKVNVIVNDSIENLYNYPFDIDYSSYNFKAGKKDKIQANENSITINSTGTGMADWTRITYDINPIINKDMIIEVDATLNSTMNDSRWFGLVFKDQETKANKAPFYQYDVRINPVKENGIELTYVTKYENDIYSYSYPYQGNDNFLPTMRVNDTVKLTLAISGTSVKAYYNDSFEFETDLHDITGGNIGFQTSGCSVTFTNLKITYQDDNKNIKANKKISNAREEDSHVKPIYSSSLKPNIIATGKTEEEIFGVGMNVTQLYAIAKKENDSLNLYDLDGNLMDFNLTYLYKWFKGSYVVNLEVNDNETVDLINNIMRSSAVIDYAIFSSNIDVLKYAKMSNPSTRLGYVSLAKSIETIEDVASECQKAGSANAYQILIDTNILTKKLVTAFTGRGYSVIGKATDGKNGSIIDATLDGCANILVKFSLEATKEIQMLEDEKIFASNSLFYQPYATAHRGAGTNGDTIDTNLCENTLSSFDKAFERGALALEIDVHTTSDGKLAVIHDDTTGNVATTNVSVRSSTLSKLQSLTLKIGNDHIPSLNEVFERYGTEKYKDKTLVIEIKDNLYETGKAVIELSKEYGWYGRFVLITFNETTAKKLHEYDPCVPSSYLGTVYRNSEESFYKAYKSYYLNGVGLSTNMACIDKECNERHNAYGEVHWVWTFNQTNNAKMTTYLNNGLRAMTTNHIRYFEENYYKLISDTNLTMNKNETKKLQAKAVSYVTETEIDNFDIILISGNATINGQNITKVDDEEIKICLKYKASWKDNGTNLTSFYVYSDVITIN